jgi:arylformamidase
VRQQAVAQLDVPYGDGDGETLDIFPPRASVPGGAPVLVFIHGGYWRALDKSDHSFLAPVFTAAGALVVVPNYAMCPAVSVEHIVLQTARMLAWVWRHAVQFGGDPSRIALAGHSAGGHLATMLLSCRWKEAADDLPVQPLLGALSISGLYDLEPLRHAPFVQADLKLTPQAVARLSPAFFPRPKAAKLYTVAGLDESEEFLRQNHLIRDVWGPTAVPVCETLPGTNHFTVLNGLADPQARLHALALRLLGLA